MTAMDLDFLRPLYDEAPSGGYVSVYLDTTPSTESAATELELRWRAARERLAADGADEATLEAVAEAFSGLGHEGDGLAVFAADGRVRLSVPLPEPPRRKISRYAPLPHVMPLLAQLPPRVPHIRIAAAHDGAEILADPGSEAAERTMAGDQGWPVHKVSAGGWSEKRLQRSAEEAWAVNAKETAAEAARAADRVGAEFAVVGGDVQQRAKLLDLLPPRLRENTVIVDREVSVGDPAFEKTTAAEAARRTEDSTRARLDEFRVRMETRDLALRRAAEGLSGTLAALRDGLAQDVLIADDPSSTSMAEEPDAGEEGRSVRDRADAILSRAAARTGAGLFFVPPDAAPITDGVAALLRAPLAAV
ncbi:MAG: hypothetical protein J2P25_17445 [Nocardiopsaceae bacterium]|nr:hypothetical protein [Nocardiopsaceae bacterium]